MKIIEKVARTLCWKNGMDPDLSLGGDKQNWLWMEYEDQAEFAVRDVIKEIMNIPQFEYINKQRLPSEMTEEEELGADYEDGYIYLLEDIHKLFKKIELMNERSEITETKG